jgi:hypothetical protein
MKKFNDKISIRNVFNVIFNFVGVKITIFRQNLVPQKSNLCNCCPILITNEQIQRQNYFFFFGIVSRFHDDS